MTRNELQLREKAVVMAYKVGNRNAAANYIMELYHRNVRQCSLLKQDGCKRSIKSIRNTEKATSFKYVEYRNVYSTNHNDVATSKRTCFAHYIGR